MFLDNFNYLCKNNGLTPHQFGRECGINKNTITNWESGKSPTIDNLMKVADFFDVSTDYLIYGTDRNTSLAPDELTLLNNYRQLSASDKEKAQKLYEIFLMPKADKQDD